MTAVAPPAVDEQLHGDPREGLEPHPDPESWTDIKIDIAFHTGLSWPDAERIWMDGLSQADAQTLAMRIGTGDPNWTSNLQGGDD